MIAAVPEIGGTVTVRGERVTRPIKGTRPRGADAAALGVELWNDSCAYAELKDAVAQLP